MVSNAAAHQEFAAALQNSVRKVRQCEDPEAQEIARTLAPINQLRASAREALMLNTELGVHQHEQVLGVEELLVQGLMAWFKGSFFTWMHSPRCQTCGSTRTENAGHGTPTQQELHDGGGRVELHRCQACGDGSNRFVRYLNVKKLLKTRTGRCGEWAHCFLLFARAAGLDARHVQDWSDHVWVEYYSHHLDRWVHLDPCEASFDQPLLYEQGWGKRLTYVIAVGRHGAADVTRRYVMSWERASHDRNLVDERWLLGHLAEVTAAMRRFAGLAGEPLREAVARELSDQLALALGIHNTVPSAATALPGRQSGPEAWRAQRGETGPSNGVTGSGADAQTLGVRPMGAMYRRAGDTKLPALFTAAGRITGGACCGSGEYSVEVVEGGRVHSYQGMAVQGLALFDGSASTKWLDFGGGGVNGTAWVEYRLLGDAKPMQVVSYDLVSGGDCPERDPAHWLLECIPCDALPGTNLSDSKAPLGQQGEGNWVVLDERQRQAFPRRHQLRSFVIPPSRSMHSRRWRLRILRAAQPAAANSMQLAAWNLYAARGTSNTLDPAAVRHACGSGSVACTSSGVHRKENGSGEGAAAPAATDEVARAQQAAATAGAALVRAEGGQTAAAALARATCLRLATNIAAQPDEPLYRRLRASKVGAQLEFPEAADLLLGALGFRPLMLPESAFGTAAKVSGEEDLALLADDSPENIAAAVAAMEALSSAAPQ